MRVSAPNAVSPLSRQTVVLAVVTALLVFVALTGRSASVGSGGPVGPGPLSAAGAGSPGFPAAGGIELTGPGTYGVAVLDRVSGLPILRANAAEPFYSASVVKLLTAVGVLSRVDSGVVTLDEPLRSDIWRSLATSDDQTMNQLWVTFDGQSLVAEVIALAGLRDTRPPTGAASGARH